MKPRAQTLLKKFHLESGEEADLDSSKKNTILGHFLTVFIGFIFHLTVDVVLLGTFVV